MFIDSHAHLTDEKLLRFNSAADIDAIITSSYNANNLKRNVQLSVENNKYYSTIGIHPQYCYEYNDDVEKYICESIQLQNSYSNKAHCCSDLNQLCLTSQNETTISGISKIVGVGEIGLDKNYDADFDIQKEVFIKQLNLAKKFGLPVVCHIRNCFDVFFDIIKGYKNLSFMIHAFSGTKGDCFKVIDLGGYISFACNITYKRHTELRKLTSIIPLDRILIETDSPSMLPASFLRKGYNTPNNVRVVAETIATERKTSIETIARATKKNAVQFFSLGIN